MINVIGKRYLFLSISGVVVIVSLVAIGMFGFREGIDFEGGVLWQLRVPEASYQEEVLRETLRDGGIIEEPRVAYSAADEALTIRLSQADERARQSLVDALKEAMPGTEELSFDFIGPSIGEELRRSAFFAIIFVLLGISIYIAFAFRKVSRPVSSWKYGVVTLITLFHDVVVPAGLLAVLGYFGLAEADGNFVVALLVVMGFSVHDTIVVFDRIRENLSKNREQSAFENIVNDSVNQALARSINTSLTLILVLIALIIVGPPTLFYFVLMLLVGVTVGIYSSVFVASPLLVVWHGLRSGKKPS